MSTTNRVAFKMNSADAANFARIAAALTGSIATTARDSDVLRVALRIAAGTLTAAAPVASAVAAAAAASAVVGC